MTYLNSTRLYDLKRTEFEKSKVLSSIVSLGDLFKTYRVKLFYRQLHFLNLIGFYLPPKFEDIILY